MHKPLAALALSMALALTLPVLTRPVLAQQPAPTRPAPAVATPAITPAAPGAATSDVATPGRTGPGPGPQTSPAPAVATPAIPTAPGTTASGTTPPAIAGRAAPGAAAPDRVNVNAAAPAQLETLPGIGPARSAAIVAGRPYADLPDLVKKKVLPQAVFDKVRGQLALANVNSSTAAEMQKTLPGIGDAHAKAIVAARPYAGPQDLVAKRVLTQPQFDRIKDLVAF